MVVPLQVASTLGNLAVAAKFQSQANLEPEHLARVGLHCFPCKPTLKDLPQSSKCLLGIELFNMGAIFLIPKQFRV